MFQRFPFAELSFRAGICLEIQDKSWGKFLRTCPAFSSLEKDADDPVKKLLAHFLP
jgi:hypothetical protein